MQLQQKRRRGAFLTLHGLYKLKNAKQQAEDNDNHHLTLELLSHRTGLDSHTVCKIFNQSASADKKSLAKCFQAFNLVLEPDDYGSFAVPSPNLNSTTFEVTPFNSILDEIEKLSPDHQRILLDVLQFRLGDHC